MTSEPPRSPAPGSQVKRWLLAGVVIALLTALVFQVATSPDDIGQLRRLSAMVLAFTVLLQFLSQLLYNSALLLPLQAYMKGLGYWEFFMVRTGGFLVGHVVPVAGGVAVRLAYLKSRGFTYRDFAWATFLSNVLALLAAAVLAVAATGILWSVAGPPPAIILVLSTGVLALSFAALTLLQSLPKLAGHPRLQRWRALSGMSDLTASQHTMMSVFGCSLVRHGLNFTTFGVLYQALSPSPYSFIAGGLVYALTSPLRMVHITPGNLGISEWVSAIVGAALAFDVTIGLVVALAFRVISLVAQGCGVLVGWAWLALCGNPPSASHRT